MYDEPLKLEAEGKSATCMEGYDDDEEVEGSRDK